MPKNRRQSNKAMCQAMLEQFQSLEETIKELRLENRKLLEKNDQLGIRLTNMSDKSLYDAVNKDVILAGVKKLKTEIKRLKLAYNQKSESKQRSGKHVPGKVDYF